LSETHWAVGLIMSASLVASMSSKQENQRPEFRGCVFCYSAEWAYYGAKKAAKSVSGANK